MYYNKYNGGVDTVDKLKSVYSVSRNSNRWSSTTFFTLMSIATINSQIIYNKNTKHNLKRSALFKTIARELTAPLFKQRANLSTLPVDLRSRINTYSDKLSKDDISYEIAGICYLCPWRKNKISKTQCAGCFKTICRKYTKAICIKCHDYDNDYGYSEE
ncbi:uncharacterized protein LOC103575594 [Microplitis demolitor]|uniref:uncharacterized protein LOC103575594 n=1 Tax=Microplitis demolitor TaxID=69319 RepID=UPI0004CD4AAD|nr:uncharacterized protein LOC103575594 [Microplitis demolitor]